MEKVNWLIEQLHVTGTFQDDLLQGESGDDIFKGKAGNDALNGNKGNDQLAGDGGRDHLIAGDGNDTLQGGAGKDILEGGTGQDFFVFDINKRFKRSIGIDTLTDFQRSDRLVLDKTTFKSIKGKRVSFAAVKSIDQVKESDALITYIRSTGALYYNQNGEDAGFGQGRHFADLTDGFSLRRSNFVVQA